MIGPHEGRELALMLAGEKKLAVFHELASRAGNIPEEIIPEQSFAPYVASGRIIRRSEDIAYERGTIRYVCFCLPGEEWRIEAFLFLKRDAAAHRRLYGDADDILMGRLLGYSETDIADFLAHRKSRL